jgi:uncharacterized protein
MEQNQASLMFFNDSVYGTFAIEEPVLRELIESESLERLKEISMAGYAEPFFPGSYHSRFEHSIGVCYLLSKFGASLEEQIAGLIHDISHTAFSHCVDYALSEGSETHHTFQDDVFETFVTQSTIPQILQRYQFESEALFDESRFRMLEQPLPSLCADRIDYVLRAGIHHGVIDRATVREFLDRLCIIEKQWVFTNSQIARQFAEFFRYANDKYYSGLESAIMCRSVGDLLKYSLRRSYINRADLFQTDRQVLAKIIPHLKEDSRLWKFWRQMNNQIEVENNPQSFDAIVTCKSRVVDPLCLVGEQVKRLSEDLPDWQEVVVNDSKPKTYHLKFQD